MIRPPRSPQTTKVCRRPGLRTHEAAPNAPSTRASRTTHPILSYLHNCGSLRVRSMPSSTRGEMRKLYRPPRTPRDRFGEDLALEQRPFDRCTDGDWQRAVYRGPEARPRSETGGRGRGAKASMTSGPRSTKRVQSAGDTCRLVGEVIDWRGRLSRQPLAWRERGPHRPADVQRSSSSHAA
jgi:hypothetical protein